MYARIVYTQAGNWRGFRVATPHSQRINVVTTPIFLIDFENVQPKALERLVPRLERISAHDHATMGMMCDELLVLLNHLDKHSGKETDLIERTLLAGESQADLKG